MSKSSQAKLGLGEGRLTSSRQQQQYRKGRSSPQRVAGQKVEPLKGGVQGDAEMASRRGGFWKEQPRRMGFQYSGAEEESSCAKQRECLKGRRGRMESTEDTECTDGLELGAQHHPYESRGVLVAGKLRTARACSRLARAGLGWE